MLHFHLTIRQHVFYVSHDTFGWPYWSRTPSCQVRYWKIGRVEGGDTHLADRMMTRASSSLASSSRAVKLVSWLNWRTFSACDQGTRKVKPAAPPSASDGTEAPSFTCLGFCARPISFEKNETGTQRLKRKAIQRGEEEGKTG